MEKLARGGVGSVRNVTFSNARVANVATPIAIDQFYCDRGGARCANRTGAVSITGVAYRRVVGTYSFQPVRLTCSDAQPCTGVSMVDVRLSPAASAPAGTVAPLCWNSYGEASGTIEPLGVGCLQRSNGYAMPLTQPSTTRAEPCNLDGFLFFIIEKKRLYCTVPFIPCIIDACSISKRKNMV
ncbi:hypothetical protein C2845_PM05G22370 [Panicum miliaceum]|uniref:Polygalacturonase n=1 Tax=Panicum miliaceum TaxID=4540 RepID=A0A3L6T0A5_PANMI|nr:hypothetical protein C2845_PM05G22370 [Panicum miliaceum]